MQEAFHLQGHTLITEQGDMMPTLEENTETRGHLLQKSIRLNANRIFLISYPTAMPALSSYLASAIAA
jgi:hypothetical protein